MTFRDTIIYFIFLLMIGLSTGAWCGQIIYPWNATTAIVKAGENFTIWYDADIDEAIESIALRGPTIRGSFQLSLHSNLVLKTT